MPYNYGATAPSEFDLVPEGTHEFFIDQITEKCSKKGRPMVEIVLKPSDFNMQKFGKVWHYIMLDNEFTEQNVGRLLAAIGRDPGNPGMIDFSSLKGEYLTAKIEHQDDGMYDPKAVVKRLVSSFRAEKNGRDISENISKAREKFRNAGMGKTPDIPQDEYPKNDPAIDDIPF